MANKTIEEFFNDLKTNEKAQKVLDAEKIETIEDLVRVTGGLAAELGYPFSDEEILGYYNDQETLLKLRSDTTAQGLSDMKGHTAGFDSDCGARQIMFEPRCKGGHYR